MAFAAGFAAVVVPEGEGAEGAGAVGVVLAQQSGQVGLIPAPGLDVQVPVLEPEVFVLLFAALIFAGYRIQEILAGPGVLLHVVLVHPHIVLQVYADFPAKHGLGDYMGAVNSQERIYRGDLAYWGLIQMQDGIYETLGEDGLVTVIEAV